MSLSVSSSAPKHLAFDPSQASSSSASVMPQPIAPLSGDLFWHCMSFLDLPGLGKARQVAKSWKALIDGQEGQSLWRDLSVREGVSLVEGEGRNYKDDFKFLRPIFAINGKTICQFFGEVVGEVPRMRLDCFARLSEPDPFELGKLVRENYRVLVDPAAIKTTVGPDRPLALDASGNLVEVSVAERAEITVPFSLKNLKMLAKYPLAGMENGPVFNRNLRSVVVDRCNPPSDRNRLLIMRKEVVARGKPFDGEHGQNAQVTNRGLEVATVRQRALFNAIHVLKTGTCSDSRKPWTYARSAEYVRGLLGHHYRAVVGSFAPGVGMTIYDPDFESETTGVVPAISAEVQNI